MTLRTHAISIALALVMFVACLSVGGYILAAATQREDSGLTAFAWFWLALATPLAMATRWCVLREAVHRGR